MRLLVTGGRTGYLGRHVVAAAAQHDVVAVGSADADVRDPAAVDALVDRHRPDAVVHTAYVQSDPEVTGAGAVHVARAAARVGARLVLVSSDVVFGGRPVPYDESATPDPVSAYGEAKVLAETAALASGEDVVVARTSLILGDGASQHEELFHRAVTTHYAAGGGWIGELRERRGRLTPKKYRPGGRVPPPGVKWKGEIDGLVFGDQSWRWPRGYLFNGAFDED